MAQFGCAYTNSPFNNLTGGSLFVISSNPNTIFEHPLNLLTLESLSYVFSLKSPLNILNQGKVGYSSYIYLN